MSLNNLVGISLEMIEPEPATIKRLVLAAKRNIDDAHVKQISLENRFDAAYKAIMQLANAALQANGYRTLTSKPGHHVTMIQTPVQTIALDNETVIVLDALRKQRNISDYSGDIIPENAVKESIIYAETLLHKVKNWLKANNPSILEAQ